MTTITETAELPPGVLLAEPEVVPVYEFDASFQQKIAALLIRDTNFAQLTDGLIRPEYFENAAYATLVKVANDYYSMYRRAPGDKTILTSILKKAITAKTIPIDLVKLAVAVIGDLYTVDVADREYVADECATFARHQAVSRAILDSVDLVDKRDFDGISTKMRKALDIGVTQDGGAYNYAENIKTRTQARKDRAAGIRPPTGITTGWKVLDDCLYHKGWGRKELSVLMGAAKAGKSMALIGFGVSAIANGYTTLYVTLEVSAEIISERLDANIAERAMGELESHVFDVEEKVTAFMSKAAPFIVHEAPTGSMKPSDLRRVLEKYKQQGIVFDLVIVDYADLMAPERSTDSPTENSKSVYLNLRGMAMREGYALLTATQTNRNGAAKAVATMLDIAEDFNKVRIADVILSLNATPEEKALKQARIFFAACRNQRSGFALRVEQNIDQAKYITKILGED
jgi:replicative DNA helicase